MFPKLSPLIQKLPVSKFLLVSFDPSLTNHDSSKNFSMILLAAWIEPKLFLEWLDSIEIFYLAFPNLLVFSSLQQHLQPKLYMPMSIITHKKLLSSSFSSKPYISLLLRDSPFNGAFIRKASWCGLSLLGKLVSLSLSPFYLNFVYSVVIN